MKYTAEFNQHTNSYIVKIGRTSKKSTKWTGVKFDTLTSAAMVANYKNSELALNTVLEQINMVSLEDAKDLARKASLLLDMVVDRCELEDADYNDSDPRGFLA